jgi:hypothetical protein
MDFSRPIQANFLKRLRQRDALDGLPLLLLLLLPVGLLRKIAISSDAAH